MTFRALLFSGLILLAAPDLRAQGDGCALLKPADVSALLGGTVVASPTGGACTWKVEGGAKKLIATRMRATGPAAEMAFTGARQGATKGGTTPVTDQAGIGDKAFSVLESFGVVVVTLKGGRVLQLQYWTGGAGTAQDLAAFLPVARKAAAAF